MSNRRLIVHIDPDRCDGCGQCVPACAEGAIQIVDGKACLAADNLCDGLGACLGQCPRDAIRLEERDADAFDQAAVPHLPAATASRPETHGCPFAQPALDGDRQECGDAPSSRVLANWPLQLGLVNPRAPWLAGADLLIAADCTAFAFPGLGTELQTGRVTLIACPKLDDARAHVAELAEILRLGRPHSIVVARMDIPCCSGLERLVQLAQREAGDNTAVTVKVVSVDGQLLPGS